MREQVIPHKVGNRSGLAGQRRGGAATQKPARRESGSGAFASRVRALLGYLPAFLKFALAIVVGVLIFAGYRTAASASFFQVRTVEVQGTSRVSLDEVRALVRKEVEKTGVWKADLQGLNSRLEHLPWVRTAVVSRVLPDGIRVRIAERVPRVVVRTASGRFRWVDEDVVLLGEMLPTDQIPSFFLRGLNEEDSEIARQENRERLQRFMELQRDWDAAGLSERVSEVNLMDLRDVRVQLAGDNSQIEVRLGSRDQAERLKGALKALDGKAQASYGSLISYIDMNQGTRAIVGLTSGAHTTSAGGQPTTATGAPPTGPPSEKKVDHDLAANAARMKANPEVTGTLENKTKKDRSDRSTTAGNKSDKSQTTARRKQ